MPAAPEQVEHERKRHLASPRYSQPTQTSTGKQARSSSTPRRLQVASLKPRTLLGTTDRDRSTGHRFYSDGTHLSEQGMVELVAALKMDVLEARMMHGSSRRLPKAAAQGCDADLIISDSSLCAVSAKASVHSNVGTGA